VIIHHAPFQANKNSFHPYSERFLWPRCNKAFVSASDHFFFVYVCEPYLLTLATRLNGILYMQILSPVIPQRVFHFGYLAGSGELSPFPHWRKNGTEAPNSRPFEV
jgi:hypothetical protein